ncbi:MAG: AbrB/MazE/SpoVT family DNA-binding domain-containing protein [Armatimonadota bacterium]|nr:AbrB/MazE/SpoVT family DNA-binding domain-containing protein [bacterium]
MSIVHLSSEFQVAIPEVLLAKLGTKPGHAMMVVERDGGIVLTPLPSDPVEFLCGVLSGEPSLTKELVTERAQEVESEE